MLGAGAFGTVLLVEEKDTRNNINYYFLKKKLLFSLKNKFFLYNLFKMEVKPYYFFNMEKGPF